MKEMINYGVVLKRSGQLYTQYWIRTKAEDYCKRNQDVYYVVTILVQVESVPFIESSE